MNITLVYERLTEIEIKATLINLSLICAHALTEEKDDVAKDAFNERLEPIRKHCPRPRWRYCTRPLTRRSGRGSHISTDLQMS